MLSYPTVVVSLTERRDIPFSMSSVDTGKSASSWWRPGDQKCDFTGTPPRFCGFCCDTQSHLGELHVLRQYHTGVKLVDTVCWHRGCSGDKTFFLGSSWSV